MVEVGRARARHSVGATVASRSLLVPDSKLFAHALADNSLAAPGVDNSVSQRPPNADLADGLAAVPLKYISPVG